MQQIVGRQTELSVLSELYNSSEAEFLAVYGRRRVGKTFLIKSFFKNKSCRLFQATGLKDGNLHDQLKIFTTSLRKVYFEGMATPKTWLEAFNILTDAIQKFSNNELNIIFLDELPWMSSPKSGLLQALDYYWNTTWVDMPNVKLIICGSAASWMLDNIVNSKGGLHNRLTRKMKLLPFSLAETKEFLKSRNIKLNNQQILEIYMAMGGIPYYLKEIKPGLSAKQNIGQICFNNRGLLFNEYDNLLSSLFKNSEYHEIILRLLNKNKHGLTLGDIAKTSVKLSSGGRLKNRLKELEAAGFIRRVVPYGKKRRNVYYQIIDEYTLFYLKWIEEQKDQSEYEDNSILWEQFATQPGFKAWAGFAFEAICYKHVSQIRHALNLNKISNKVGTWRHVAKTKDDSGAQIDLLFDRIDNVITLCEIKHRSFEYTIDKKYYSELIKKQEIFLKQTQCSKQIFWCMITASPLKENQYSRELVLYNVTLDDLFWTENCFST